MKTIYEKYAHLLSSYCLQVKKGDKVFIKSTYLAEPLLQELVKEVCLAGGIPVLDIEIQAQEKIIFDHSEAHQLEWINPLSKYVMEEFDCYLVIRAPFNLYDSQGIDPAKRKISSEARKGLMKTYMERTGSYDLRRSLCQFPTQASAQEAGMGLKEYEDFVFNACNLFYDDPIAEWKKLSKRQESIVEHLNQCTKVHYKGNDIDIHFSTEGRIWINSDGKTNMPSGEVYTAPVENSVNGYVRFSHPSIYMGTLVEDIRLEVKDGEVVKWDAKRGKELLDKVFDIPGARRFGEAAVGTNFNINRFTKNILFDEKIGGTIHMAIGQSYHQCGGKNDSAIHWDMIADMTNGGEIFADGEKVYENGKFLI
ncbi:MAG: aminopeptidase [Chitinophagales bacterium]|nr:aminopeptidase [Chitinophagales bacterium]